MYNYGHVYARYTYMDLIVLVTAKSQFDDCFLVDLYHTAPHHPSYIVAISPFLTQLYYIHVELITQ